MNSVDYMQNNDGNITMFCEQIPDKGFVDAIKIRNICMVCIRTIAQKKQYGGGGPDVDLISVSGEQSTITKKQLQSDFVHCNGKRIKVSFLKTGHKYYVYNVCKQPEPYKVLKLPDNCKGSIGTKEARPGSYIVCRANEDGTVNRDTMYVISDTMFKKCFKIPIQAVIKRHMYRNANRSFGLFNPQRLAEIRGFNKQNSIQNIERSYAQNKNKQHTISLGTGIDMGIENNVSGPITMPGNDSNIQNKVVRMPNILPNRQIVKPQQQQPVRQSSQIASNNTENNKDQYKYTITHRVLSSTNSALLGYVVKELSSGRSKQLGIQQVMTLCERHLVNNVMLVKRDNGIKFLKGNNMRIESLPHILG